MLSTSILYANASARIDTVRETGEVSFSSVQRDIDYFRENIKDVSGPEDILGDYKLYSFVMTAFDLESQLNSRGLIRRIMTEDVNDDESLVNKLSNIQYKEFATKFSFAGQGELSVSLQSRIEDVVDRYITVRTEQREGELSPGVRLALYFERNAPKVESYFGLLGDRPLREFVFTAFQFPDELNQLGAEDLAAKLEERFAIEDLQDPEKRQQLIQRFSALYDAENGLNVPSSPVVALAAPLSNAPQVFGISAETLLSLRTF